VLRHRDPTRKISDHIEVKSRGWQYLDGRIEHQILVCTPGEPLSAESSRRLGAALIEAGHELDSLAGPR
jgi:hypothetical protein